MEESMGDDKSNRGAADRTRINISEDYEVRYWSEELGCTEAALREAVLAVGPSASAVRAHLSPTNQRPAG
jgi:uncharacterized protein DUF3606